MAKHLIEILVSYFAHPSFHGMVTFGHWMVTFEWDGNIYLSFVIWEWLLELLTRSTMKIG